MKAVVVALGKIGLPLAAQIARSGHEVVGCDIDERVVRLVNAAEAPFPGEAGLGEALAEVVGDGRLRAQLDTVAAVAEGPDLVVAVPPLAVDADARPDWRTLDAVVGDIADGLALVGPAPGGVVVSIETTLPVGTMRSRVSPAIEQRSGLAPEQDFFCAFSPERVYSGRVFQDLRTYPKLVGGLSAAGEARAIELYRAFIETEVRGMGSAEAAEFTKLAETTYRDVNIALANEFARFADRAGVDVDRVIDAANTQPFSHIHRPGVAVGGHCIPVYPRFYLHTDERARLPLAAREINGAMPAYAVDLLEEALDGGLPGTRVLILGVTYRGGVKETAFSGAFAVRDELAARGAHPLATDPLYDDGELRALGFEPWDGHAIDGAILQANHDAYATLGPGDLPGVVAIVDGRRALDAPRFETAGIRVRLIGGGAQRRRSSDATTRSPARPSP